MQNRLGRRFAPIAILLFAVPAAAITLGQIDDFQAGTLQGWTGGTTATNQPSGGPGGAGDRYVRLNSAGAQPRHLQHRPVGGELRRRGCHSRRHRPQQLRAESREPPAHDLHARLCVRGRRLHGLDADQRDVLPAGSGWVKVEFSLAEPDLTRVIGADSYAATIANVERLHLKHDDGPPDPPGTQIFVNAVLGMDNVVALPEPAPTAVFLAGALTLACVPRGRRGKRGNELPSER